MTLVGAVARGSSESLALVFIEQLLDSQVVEKDNGQEGFVPLSYSSFLDLRASGPLQ